MKDSKEKNIKMRNFEGKYGVSEDYIKLHKFLVKSGYGVFTYARLDWMITHDCCLQEEFLDRIGLWEENGEIVGADVFDSSLDDIYPIVLTGYEFLYEEMLEYACKNMINEKKPDFRVCIEDTNEALVRAAKKCGLKKTGDKDCVASFDFADAIPEFKLKEGYSIVSMADELDYENYLHCLYNGFGHSEEGEFSYTKEDKVMCQRAFERIYVDLSLKISVKAPNGSYVAHCGMWYDKDSDFAFIEPVCTDPDYRRMGLGSAAVLEGLRRVKALGAKYAVVGSNQHFYYSIGLKPYAEGTFWVK